MNNEMNWIRGIAPNKHHHSSVKVGIGDDAAIYSVDEGMESVIAVDTMVEGVHFTKKTMTIPAIGYKALAVNVSDLAAMGAIPLYYLVSIAIPKQTWTKDELNALYQGMDELASQWKIDLIGGDTVSIDNNLVITVTVVGMIEKGRRLVRTNAQIDDVVFVTGKLGSAAYGLERLLQSDQSAIDEDTIAVTEAIQAHQRPQPQVEAGRTIAQSGLRTSLNDISDGLASEAKELADASEVSIHIDWDKLPKATYIEEAPSEKQEEWVLYGGEDFQLVGTVSPTDWKELQQLFEKNKLTLFKIGYVGKEKGQVFLHKGKEFERLTRTGYDHL